VEGFGFGAPVFLQAPGPANTYQNIVGFAAQAAATSQEGDTAVRILTANLGVILLLLTTAMAFGQAEGPEGSDGFYLGGFGGVASSNSITERDPIMGFNPITIDLHTGFYGGLEAGLRDVNGRVGLELAMRNVDVDSLSSGGVSVDAGGDLDAISLMATFIVYLDDDPWAIIRPYYGAGLGVSFVGIDIAGESEDDVLFTWQATIGAEFSSPNVGPGPVLFVGYKVMGTTYPKFGDFEYDPLLIHGVEFGLRFDF